MVNSRLLAPEIRFITSRSSGPGGQNVNKVNSKVTLSLDIKGSSILTGEQKEILLKRLGARVTKDGTLLLSSQEKRSQFQNKEAVLQKFDDLLTRAFEKRKKRRNTKPSKASVQNRLKGKKLRSEKKKWRQKF